MTEAEKKLEEYESSGIKCNTGHVNNLPLKLWDCPVCTDIKRKKIKDLGDAAEMLWIVLANVSGGDWKKQTPEWQEAAARWRDNYMKVVRS